MIKRLKALGIILYLLTLMVTLVPLACFWGVLCNGYWAVREEFREDLYPHWKNAMTLAWRVLTRPLQKERAR